MLALHCVVILGAFCVALCVCSVIRLELVVCFMSEVKKHNVL